MKLHRCSYNLLDLVSISLNSKLPAMAESLVNKLPNGLRNHLLAMVAEFFGEQISPDLNSFLLFRGQMELTKYTPGTTSFLFLAFAGTQIANTRSSSDTKNFQAGPDLTRLLYISFSFAAALMVNVWIFYRISGGQFNPAVSLSNLFDSNLIDRLQVTLGLCLVGAVPPIRGALIVFGQFLGGIIAAALVSGIFPGPLAVTTSLDTSTSTARGFWIETFLTTQLVLTVIMLAVVKHKATYLAPIGIGCALFIIQMTGTNYSVASFSQLLTKFRRLLHWRIGESGT